MKLWILCGVVGVFLTAQGAEIPAVDAMPRQSPSELKTQIQKFKKLSQARAVMCEKQDTRKSQFVLKLDHGRLVSSGALVENENISEFYVGEFTVVHFAGNNPEHRSVAVIDAFGTLYTQGESEGTLLQLDSGKVTRAVKLACSLAKESSVR